MRNIAKTLAMLVWLWSGPAVALPILYSSIPDLDAAPTINGWETFPAGVYEAYDRFTLTDNSQVLAVSFAVTDGYGVTAGPDPYSSLGFVVKTDTGGLPDVALVAVGSGASSPSFSYVTTANGTGIVTIQLSNFHLTPGAYWLGIGSELPLQVPSYSGGDGTMQTFSKADGYLPTGQTMGFTILGVENPIPEPSAWALMILGFGFAGAAVRQGRRAISAPTA